MIWIRNYEDGWKSKAKVGHRNRVAVHWPKEYKHFYSKKYSTRIEDKERASRGPFSWLIYFIYFLILV